MAWATISETLTYTGITVGADNIEAAQAMIELFADVTEDSDDNITSKNARLLKMAVAYQAAWITDHPDVFTHIDISTMLQDGIQYSQRHENAGVLAPMARRAIDRLSWRRTRSIRIRKRNRRRSVLDQTVDFVGGYSGRGYGSKNNTPFEDDDLSWTAE
jgi:hypothetical protein